VSTFNSGHRGLVIANTNTSSKTVKVDFMNGRPGSRYYWYTLEAGGKLDGFSRQIGINGEGPDLVAGGQSNYKEIPAYSAQTEGGIKVEVPGHSVVYMMVESN
jgi:hypothetical protein